MLEGGITTVTQVMATESAQSQLDAHGSGTFGLGAALASLFTVGMSSQIGGHAASTNEKSTQSDRIHTPASLFYILKTRLESLGMSFYSAAASFWPNQPRADARIWSSPEHDRQL